MEDCGSRISLSVIEMGKPRNREMPRVSRQLATEYGIITDAKVFYEQQLFLDTRSELFPIPPPSLPVTAW